MSFFQSDFSLHRQDHVPSQAGTQLSDLAKTRRERRLVYMWYAAFSIVILTCCGCGKKELEKLKSDAEGALNSVTEKAKQATDKVAAGVEKATNTIQEAIGPGSMDITLDSSPVSSNACFAHFIEQAPGRSNVLKLQSHLDMKSLQFPAALIQIEMDSSLDKMIGQTVGAVVYIQATKDGPIWTSDQSEKVQVKIETATTKTVKVDIVGGKLTSTGGKTIDAAGSLVGILQ